MTDQRSYPPHQIAPTLGVALVVVREGERFVLVEEAKASCRHQWSLPGGVMEAGESIVEAARREALEECGLVVEPTALIRVEHVHYDAEAARVPYRQKLRFVVLAEARGGSLKRVPDAESLGAALFTVAEARALRLREPRVLDWLEAVARGVAGLPLAHYEHLKR